MRSRTAVLVAMLAMASLRANATDLVVWWEQGFYAQVGRDQDSAYAFAMELMSSAAMIPDAQEGFAAFLEKRKPEFDRR